MKTDPTNQDALIFDSGRVVSANCGIVGIDQEGQISEGYDGALVSGFEPLTRDERRDLAEYMIGLWKAYALADPDEQWHT